MFARRGGGGACPTECASRNAYLRTFVSPLIPPLLSSKWRVPDKERCRWPTDRRYRYLVRVHKGGCDSRAFLLRTEFRAQSVSSLREVENENFEKNGHFHKSPSGEGSRDSATALRCIPVYHYNLCAVYPCVPLCTPVYSCVPLCTPVCAHVYPCVLSDLLQREFREKRSFSQIAFRRGIPVQGILPQRFAAPLCIIITYVLCTPVYPCVPLSTPVYPCVPLCTPVYPCVPLCVPMCTPVCCQTYY
jgi:hypothetical protein